MRRRWVVAGSILWWSALASAQQAAATATAATPSAEEILRKMDAYNNDFADQERQIRLTIIDVDGSKKSYDLSMWQKGDWKTGKVKRLVEFTSGEVKGQAMLAEDRDSVYVYLPGMKKVRRVAASNMNQTFAGSDLSSEDMAIVAWSSEWTAQVEKGDEASWWLSLTPKPGSHSEYARVEHRVSKKDFDQMETHYFNKAGELTKDFVPSDPGEFHGVVRNRHVVVTDPRTGHKTEIDVKDFKVNQGLKDEMFTVRQLQWGK